MVKFRKDILITAMIITIGIFFLGLYSGRIWDNLRTNQIEQEITENNLDILSIFVGQEFLKSFDIENCDVINKRLSSMSYDLYKTGLKLADYEAKNLISKKEYDYLKTQYFLLELRAYTNYLDFKKTCNTNQTIILYFYDVKQLDSERQGYVLDKMVERKDFNVRVFSIDRQHDETTLNMLKEYYEVKQSPTIIINGNLKKEGFLSLGEVEEILKNENL